MEPIEERFLIAVLAIVVLIAIPFLLGRFKKSPKSEKKLPISFLILLLGFLLLILAAQYSQFRTYSILSIVTMIIFSIALPLILSVMLWKFREAPIFSGNEEISSFGKIYKLSMIFISYLLLLGVINTGFSFLFNGIINPQIVALTPEFERYAIPIMSGLVLVVFRFTGLFGSKLTETLGKIFEDIVIFSLSMSWLSVVSFSLGIKIEGASLEISNATSIVVIAVAFAALGIEWFVVRFQKDLSYFAKPKTPVSLTEQFQLMLAPLLIKSTDRQLPLDYFFIEKPIESPQLKSRFSELVNHFSIFYRGHILRMTKLLTVAGIVVMLLFCYGTVLLSSSHETLIAAPAYSIELSLTNQSQLSSNAIRILSEEVETLKPKLEYALPIVSVTSSNESFTGPLSRRLESLNATGFLVLETDNYLTIKLQKITVETTVIVTGFGQQKYNQTNNSAFDYVGFFRDGELFYALAKNGFNQVSALSSTGGLGEQSIVEKYLFSINTSGDSACVAIKIQSDVMAIDNTGLISSNEDFIDQAVFLLHQTKLNTIIKSNIANVTEPFHICKDS